MAIGCITLPIGMTVFNPDERKSTGACSSCSFSALHLEDMCYEAGKSLLPLGTPSTVRRETFLCGFPLQYRLSLPLSLSVPVLAHDGKRENAGLVCFFKAKINEGETLVCIKKNATRHKRGE